MGLLPQSTATPNTENGASEEREADFSSYEVYREVYLRNTIRKSDREHWASILTLKYQ